MTQPEPAPTRWRLSRALLLGLATAGLLMLAFLPGATWLLVWVALAPWLVASTRVDLYDAVRVGIVVSVVSTLGLIFWCAPAVSDYFGVPIGWAWAGVVMIALLAVAPYWVPFGVWVCWASRRVGLNPWLVGGAWAFCEFARNHGFFPWLLFAYAPPPGSALLQAADLFGPYGIGAGMAAVSALAAALVVPSLRPRHFAVHALGIAALLLAAWSYGEWRLGQEFREGPAIEVALVQPDFDRHQRWVAAYRERNFGYPLALSVEASQRDPAIILWPEFAVEAPLPADAATLRRLRRHSARISSDLVLGALHGERDLRWRGRHNSAFHFHQGKLLGRYDKLKLVPFTERSIVPGFLETGKGSYRPGNAAVPLELRDTRMGVSLCWDAMHPEVMRAFAANGADSFANLSRDEWYGDSIAARQQLQAVALRAIENRRFIARPTSGGFTTMIDAHGRIGETGTYGEADIVYADLYTSTTVTPYQRIGDVFPWVAGAGALIWPYWVGRRSKRHSTQADPHGPESDAA